MPLPRCVTIEVDADVNEWHHLTPLSDLHIESTAFPEERFISFMQERNEMGNHRAIIIGDCFDLVNPPDLKRFRQSVSRPSTRDDWTNEAIEIGVDTLKATGTQIDMVSPGNHEDEHLKRHGFCATSALAHELRCKRGGYSGFIVYRLRLSDSKILRFPIVYHHGAWGGRVVKGFAGARDYFRSFDGWMLALFGHNHQCTVLPELKTKLATGNRIVKYKCYYVCTGSWVESWSDNAEVTHYAERAGHMPSLQTTPLISFRVVKRGSHNDGRYMLDYHVTA